MSDRLKDAPIGTRAPAIMGGAWYKVGRGRWKWNGPGGTGGTFPGVGGDWTGKLIYPTTPASPEALPSTESFAAAFQTEEAKER